MIIKARHACARTVAAPRRQEGKGRSGDYPEADDATSAMGPDSFAGDGAPVSSAGACGEKLLLFQHH